jgi:hypothetical protein
MRGNKMQQVRTGAALAVALLVGGLVAACTPPAEPIVTFPAANGPLAVTDAPNELRGPLKFRGRDLVDADGRVVQLRGTNAVQKSAPFIYSVTDGKLAGLPVDELVRRGYNAVRLGVWPAALMPTPGGVDTAYLETVAQTVADLEAAGIWVLLDLHQDVFWGMPSWATPADAVNLSEAPAPGFEVIGWAARSAGKPSSMTSGSNRGRPGRRSRSGTPGTWRRRTSSATAKARASERAAVHG